MILITQLRIKLLQYANSILTLEKKYNMKRFLLYLLIISIHATSCGQRNNETASTSNGSIASSIDANEFEKGIQQADVQILDVRTAGEFASGHLKNAMQANYNNQNEFVERTKHLDKNKPVYIYCLSGMRSQGAMSTLQEMGFNKLYHLVGGINSWKRSNKPVEGMIDEPQISIADYQNITSKDSIVLVDFGANWCPPCKKMEPIINQFITENPKVKLVKVDGGTQQTVMQAMNVTALPVFIIYKNGKQVWRKDGVATIEELRKYL